ncbi:MAG: hybrid sensor histidine kinase/response regulator [Clostridia bacterium]|nr:hybrid sensor histidine kinase/response regulator [Clostridia bacterium]
MEANSKILLVDDNPINIRVAAKILRSHNYNISFSQSGKDALEKTQKVPFDLILLDVMMPDMDGYEVCRLLKENPVTDKIPVIFLTAKTEPESIVRGFDVGGADYVTKPFHGQELLARVETHIRLRQSLEQLKQTNQLLTESNDTKDKMFSIISHDLLGPFGSIRESLEMLATNQVVMDDESMKHFVKALWQSIGNAYALLENLLYWARNQQGQMIYKPRLVDLNQAVHETYDLLAGMAQIKDITLKSNLIENYTAYADKNAVKTILRNLVSNAIKFTNPGGTITTRIIGKDDGYVEVSVHDDGVGMTQETMGRLFSGKSKNDPKWGTSGEKGVGLGLIITKEFIEKHNGTIRIDSTPGEGSTFYFTLPKNNN